LHTEALLLQYFFRAGEAIFSVDQISLKDSSLMFASLFFEIRRLIGSHLIPFPLSRFTYSSLNGNLSPSPQ